MCFRLLIVVVVIVAIALITAFSTRLGHTMDDSSVYRPATPLDEPAPALVLGDH